MGGGDHILRLVSVDGQLSQEFAKGTGSINSVSFSPSGKHLASGGDDGVVRVYCLSDSSVREYLGNTS